MGYPIFFFFVLFTEDKRRESNANEEEEEPTPQPKLTSIPSDVVLAFTVSKPGMFYPRRSLEICSGIMRSDRQTWELG